MTVPKIELNNGTKIPQIGFGTWLAAPGVVGESVVHAIQNGFRQIDCAFCYGNETEVGAALKKVLDSGVKREDLWITSKLWNTYHKDVRKGFEKSLSDLGLSYLDLYLIHWPMGYDNGGDFSVNFPKDKDGKIIFSDSDWLDAWREMEALVDEGKIKSIGISNFNQSQVQRLLDKCRITNGSSNRVPSV